MDPIYTVTSFAVYAINGRFFVGDTTADQWERHPSALFDTLEEALEFADNGELSAEALAVLKNFA